MGMKIDWAVAGSKLFEFQAIGSRRVSTSLANDANFSMFRLASATVFCSKLYQFYSSYNGMNTRLYIVFFVII